jgi:predicted nuclease with TOPRIM domain
MGDMPVEEEDDVLDIDDLTDAQEKVNKTVNDVGKDLGKVDNKLEKLMGAIDKLSSLFDMNNQKIEDLKTEFEKRNPTQTEKLNIRSLDSFPFNVSPNDYWVEKAKNSNYSAYGDNSEPTTQEYVITNNDVDDMSERDVADSFFVADELNQNLKKIFGIA